MKQGRRKYVLRIETLFCIDVNDFEDKIFIEDDNKAALEETHYVVLQTIF